MSFISTLTSAHWEELQALLDQKFGFDKYGFPIAFLRPLRYKLEVGQTLILSVGKKVPVRIDRFITNMTSG